MKLLRPTADPNAQLELPLAEPAPAAPAPQNLLAPQADPAAPSADVWPPALPNGRMLQIGERTLHYALKRSSRRTISRRPPSPAAVPTRSSAPHAAAHP